MNNNRTAILGAALVTLLAISGCGSNGEAEPKSVKTSEAAPASDRQGRPDGDQLEKIRECLKAAGLEDKMPSGDMPSRRPTEMPEGRPSEAPEGGLRVMQDPEVQDALTACGIEMPQPPSGGPR